MNNHYDHEENDQRLTYAQLCCRLQKFYTHLTDIEKEVDHITEEELKEVMGDISFRDIIFELAMSFEKLFELAIYKE